MQRRVSSPPPDQREQLTMSLKSSPWRLPRANIDNCIRVSFWFCQKDWVSIQSRKKWCVHPFSNDLHPFFPWFAKCGNFNSNNSALLAVVCVFGTRVSFMIHDEQLTLWIIPFIVCTLCNEKQWLTPWLLFFIPSYRWTQMLVGACCRYCSFPINLTGCTHDTKTHFSK